MKTGGATDPILTFRAVVKVAGIPFTTNPSSEKWMVSDPLPTRYGLNRRPRMEPSYEKEIPQGGDVLGTSFLGSMPLRNSGLGRGE